MANTLGGINLAQIAQDSLDYLTTEFHIVRAFARDFSSDIEQEGESVTTRVPSAITVQDLSSGYTPTDVTTTAKTITLNKFKGHVRAFTDLEVSKAGDAEWLANQFIEPALEAVRDAFMDDLLALVLNAAFSNNVVITAANFDADDVADLAGDLTTLKCPKRERALLLPPTYYASIQKDAVVQDTSSYGGSDAIKEHGAKRIHGFNVYEYTGIPANGENLAAIAMHPSAMIMAARQVAVPQNAPHVAVENVEDPATGLPLQFRAWYDANAGKHIVSVGVLYGVAVGNGAALKRIKSA